MSKKEEQKKKDEETEIYNEVIEWIEKNDAHFKRNCKILYDSKNLERIKRFANAPMDYIDERIALNKKVSESYHKLYQSILLAGFTGLIVVLFSQSVVSFAKSEITFLSFVIILIFIGSISIIAAMEKTSFLRLIGLLKVIRDSEIEIYYLSKIKEHRKKEKVKLV